ncbi:MAG: Serine/threonine-protein kinase PknD [Thermoanaerobaculia bacterium]|nr:Serine/threonine-protein kinase PknD [Thermoanaerobaculia bacterium]
MTDARLARKQELLAACAAVSAELRPGLLAERCGDDPALRAEVEGLLQYLGAPTPGAGAELEALLEDRIDQRYLGQRFGPYTVQRLLARGGFSRVFLATRSFEDQERAYALKVPLGGSFAEEAARYRLEIAILSQLRHPNLAGLVDVVAGPGDEPLLVLDYLDGALPITAAAAERRLSVRERIVLFSTVLDALRSAHERGVIHCDLSAANVVVRRDGAPVVIDFGIAKVSWERSGSVTVGPRPLTYEYASPEQYRGEPLTVRTDIYSAGVLLYELLTGSLPHRLDRRDIEACRRDVLEGEIERPSRRVLASPVDVPGSTRAISRQLRGDLDAIVLKALERDPARRYESVAAFLDDLLAHLELRPVAAKAPGVADRSWRWARRHPATSATLALALVLSTGFGAFHVQRLQRERARATRIADELRDVLKGFDPAQAKKNPVTVRDLLDQATEKFTKPGTEDEPLVRGAVLDTLGVTYASIGDLETAEKLLRTAVTLRSSGSRADRAESANNLGTLLVRQDKLTEAEPLIREALALRTRDVGPDSAEVATHLANLAQVRQGLGDYREAASLLDRVLQIQQTIDPKGFGVLQTRNLLANLLIESGGGYDRALSLHVQNVTDLRAMLGPTHPYVALALNNLAHAEDETGKHAEAQQHYAEALALDRTIYGTAHPEIALMLNNLAVSEAADGKLDVAEGHAREALAMRRKILGDAHGDTVVTLRNLAHVLRLRGQLDESETLFREALATTRKLFGDDHPNVAAVLAQLGMVHRDRGDYVEAETLLADAVKRDRTAFTKVNLQALKGLNALASTEAALGKLAEAEKLLREVLDGVPKAGLPKDHDAAGEATVLLATVLQRAGRASEAISCIDAGLATFKAKPEVVSQLKALQIRTTGR